ALMAVVKSLASQCSSRRQRWGSLSTPWKWALSSLINSTRSSGCSVSLLVDVIGRPLVRTSTKNRAKACSRRTLFASIGMAAIQRNALWFFVIAINSPPQLRHCEFEIWRTADLEKIGIVIREDDAVRWT